MIPTYGYARGGQGSIATWGYGTTLLVASITIDIISFTLAQCRLVEFTVEL